MQFKSEVDGTGAAGNQPAMSLSLCGLWASACSLGLGWVGLLHNIALSGRGTANVVPRGSGKSVRVQRAETNIYDVILQVVLGLPYLVGSNSHKSQFTFKRRELDSAA